MLPVKAHTAFSFLILKSFMILSRSIWMVAILSEKITYLSSPGRPAHFSSLSVSYSLRYLLFSFEEIIFWSIFLMLIISGSGSLPLSSIAFSLLSSVSNAASGEERNDLKSPIE